MAYNNTQPGHLTIVILVILSLYFGFLLTLTGINSMIIAIMLFVLIILFSFSWLNVAIDKDYLKIKFGYGIYKKRFNLSEIKSVKRVKNHWYYGWGIRLWLWPRMVIFNISGFDAVEIIMNNNKIYRIGTNQPKKLEREIMSAIK